MIGGIRTTLHRALALLVVLFAAHRALVPMAETDLFFHLKLGDLILEQHHIPFRNLFSFTFPDHPDQDLAWAFQVACSLCYRAGGFTLIVLFKSALVVAAAARVWRACRLQGAGPTGSALATLIAIAAADQRLCERPHLCTFVGIGVLHNLLAAADQGRTRTLRWLPLVAWVWANFHAGVFLSIIMLVGWAIGARLEGRRPAPRRTLLLFGGLALISLACTPARLQLPGDLLWHTGLGSTRIVEEFRRADPWNDPWFFIEMTLCAITVVRLGRRTPWRLVVPALVVAWLAWRSVRFAAEWALIGAPLVAQGLSRAGAQMSARARHVFAALSLASLLALIGSERRGFALGLAPDVAPFEAIRFATDNRLRERMFHDFDVGCYLLWEGWPRYQVFEDARLPAYPHSFHREMDESVLSTPQFQAILERYQVDAALVAWPELNPRRWQFPREDWALVYRREDAWVFAKRVPRHRAVIETHELSR
jgi:hypothetical protein